MSKFRYKVQDSMVVAESEIVNGMISFCNKNLPFHFSDEFRMKMNKLAYKLTYNKMTRFTIQMAVSFCLVFTMLFAGALFMNQPQLVANRYANLDLSIEMPNDYPGLYFSYGNPYSKGQHSPPPREAVKEEKAYLNPEKLKVDAIVDSKGFWNDTTRTTIYYKEPQGSDWVARLDRHKMSAVLRGEYIEEEAGRFYTNFKTTNINGYEAVEIEGHSEVCWIWRDEFFIYEFVIDLIDGEPQYPIEEAISFIDHSGTVETGSFRNCLDDEYISIGRTKKGERIYEKKAS